jgi:hypothetical protein
MNIVMRSPNDFQISVVNNERIAAYMERIRNGEQLPPVTVKANNPHRLSDGNHRAAAYKKLGMLIPTLA